MRKVTEQVKHTAKELLHSEQVDAVLSFSPGELNTRPIPYMAKTEQQADNLQFNAFSEQILSKYLIDNYFLDKFLNGDKLAITLKGCDLRGLNLLLREERLNREQLYLIGLDCPGMISRRKLEDHLEADPEEFELSIDDNLVTAQTMKGSAPHATESEKTLEIPLEKVLSPFCLDCNQPTPSKADVDQLIVREHRQRVDEPDKQNQEGNNRHSHIHSHSHNNIPNGNAPHLSEEIEEITKLPVEERFEFWKSYLNNCRRCYSCRNACPACTCITCMFDREVPNYLDKATDQLAQHQFYHLIRAFHVSDRCVGCGQCERVCPEGIPLHLIHRKLIHDMNELYGSHEPGVDPQPSPLETASNDDPDPFEKEEG